MRKLNLSFSVIVGTAATATLLAAMPARAQMPGEHPNLQPRITQGAVSAIAAQVRRSVGPSGSNRDYVLRLAEALRALRVHDDHLFEVAEQVGTGGCG